jgi:O-antigen/teichoic acid export membrane protein
MKTTSLDYWRDRVRNTHPRTRKAQINTILGLFIKGGGMVISLLLVPLTIDYLSITTYGTWLTISSIVTMLTFLDIGIGNGLRNKFSEAIANQDITLARTYVSTAYLVFGGLQIVFIFVFAVSFRYIPWQKILNTSIDHNQLLAVVLITAVAMSIKLVFDILSYILLAIQESGLTGIISLLSNILIIGGTYLLTQYSKGNLIYLAMVTAFSPIVMLFFASAVFYRGRLKKYRPAFKLVDLIYSKSLLSLGYKFFFIQIAYVVLFYTDNLIITQLFGPAEVTTYNIAFRYFNAIGTMFAIAITPYWSAFTEAYVKNDTAWMQTTYRYLKRLWVGLAVSVIIMILMSDRVYSLWIGDRVYIPLQLSIWMGVSVIITCWNNVTVSVINGTGKIKVQLYSSFVAAIINIPMAIAFGKYLSMGSAGVILATCLSLLIGAVLGAVQASKLINDKASDIWVS